MVVRRISPATSTFVIVALVALATTDGSAAPQLKWMRRDSKVEYQPFNAPGGRFVVQFPRRDWRIVPGGGSVVVTLAQTKGEAAVVIEHTSLNAPLAPEDITDLFAEIEMDELKKRNPGATAFRPGIVTGPEGRQSEIQFTRPGVNGSERVRQVSMPRRGDLYRIVCSAPVDLFPKYEAVFSHILESFRSGAAGTSTPGAALPSAPAKSAVPSPDAASARDTAESSARPPVDAPDAPAQKTMHVDAQIPRGATVGGEVQLRITISAAGEVVEVGVLRGEETLRPAAVAAVRQWKYRPATKNGVAVASTTVVSVHFRLQ